MDRPNDPFWNDVEDMKCKFCGYKFARDTSISRIKWHLSGERGHGVSICGQVPKEVQEAAFLAMRGGNKRHKSIPSSSNVNDYAISTFPQEQDNAGDAGRMQVGVQGMENTGEGSFQQVPTIGIYDVFLSFRGEDTRKTITDHLHSALIQAGIRTFRDDNDLPRGEEISPQLLRAIEGSRISVVVFSRNYASSRWCLDELVKIMECRQKTHQVVLPTFYDTDPSDVRKQTGSYAKAFDEHEKNFKGEMEKVNRWREALTEAANLSGRVLHETNGYEAEFIKRVVSDVAFKLGNKTLHVAKHPVGISSKEMVRTHYIVPSDPSCLDHGRHYDQPFAPSVNNDVIMNDVQNMVRGSTKPMEEHDVENSGILVQPGAGARSSKRLKYNKTRGVPFPTSSNKPVGQAFEENTKEIWSLLMNDEVSTIGIFGMGGVGKTTILQHIYNELIQRPDICDHVWWVTVSQDFTINRLQNLIAKRFDLDLSSEDDDPHRAAKLSYELRNKQKWILILDDLWNSFELYEVGIDSLLKGCKLILTTRSQTVCAQIDCQHKIEVKPLFEGESWTLFKENLGRHMALSDEVKEIAKDVARECDGLPLGIITVAKSMRGVKNLNEWRNTLKELRKSGYRDMNEKVIKVLRVSYDRLDDELALKECLLYCVLFSEDDIIERGKLIGYLIDEGIIKGMRRRQDAFDKGHTMLDRLEYFSLLESAKNEDDLKCVMMHDLIRDMGIQILQENSQVIVEAGAQLEELPDAEEWTENLARVSLMKNQIKEIPSSYSPMCPNLSTLLLCENRGLVFIADSFFKQLRGLKVLDLSDTGIEKLPESVSDLVSLTALLLIDCGRLRYVPSLEKLRALKSLDLYRTSLEKIPQGMECLSNLRYFRINGFGVKEFPSGILPKLSHLQVFVLGEFRTECYTFEGMEVGCLGKLETLECHFKGFSDFVKYLTSRDGIHSLSTYKISVGTLKGDYWDEFDDFPNKTVRLGNLSVNRDRDFQVKFLNGIQGLYYENIDARSLCDVLSLENATELEIIRIEDCDSMESLVSSSWFCSATPPLPSHNGMFSRLKEFTCVECNNMEKLFPLELLSYLVNLEEIYVGFCDRMEEIIGTTDEESSTSNPITELTLPKLKALYLIDLDELKRICSANLICNSLKAIEVVYCEKLKRMAISLPLLENCQLSPHPSLEMITVHPKEWWETLVEWESPKAKEALLPIVHFLEEEWLCPEYNKE